MQLKKFSHQDWGVLYICWENHCRVYQGSHLRSFLKKIIFYENLYFTGHVSLCFKHHWYIFPPYFCIVLKSLRIEKNIKQDNIAQSLECRTKKCDFFSCTSSNPVSDIMFLSLIFWTLFELCTRANINLWLIKWKNRRLWSQCGQVALAQMKSSP